MPINPSALPSEPSDQIPGQMEIGGGEATQEKTSTRPKRGRRSKAEMIADAIIPKADELVQVKDAGTGAKVERPWAEAAQLVKDEKAEFTDKTLKYALMKAEEASDGVRVDVVSSPAGAQVGDEVIVGSETYLVGHGGILVGSSKLIADTEGNIIKPQRRWQRELGTGLDGPWESKVLTQTSDPRPIFDGAFIEPAAPRVEEPSDPAQNGHSDAEVTIETQRLPATYEQVGPVEWKIGTGIMEKIGLPDYSNIVVGPITASRMVFDDGRRTEVQLGDKTASIPTVAIEIGVESANICEYIARYQRGEVVSFLQSTGALKQPVS